MIRYPLLTLLLLAGCTTAPEKSPEWQEITVPNPMATVRDVVHCGDSWVAVGAMRLGADPSVAPNEQQGSAFRPAAWRWRDGAWQEIITKPVSFYGERAILRQVACKGNDFAVLGGASGGAHGNLRITTWFAQDGRDLIQNPLEDFEMFGGNSAIGVEQMVSFDGGYLMAGNWRHESGKPGPAVWLSPDGRSWRRLPEDPALASADGSARQANGAVSFGDRVLLLGEQRSGSKEVPFVATTTDGQAWRPVELAGEGSVLAGSTAILAAWHGPEIATWKFTGQWRPEGGFAYGAGPQPPRVTGITGTLIGVCGGSACGLWHYDAGKWQAQKLPSTLPATPTSLVLLATNPAGVTLLVLTDGNNLRIFLGKPRA
jgi:hypothetical protein